MPRSHNCGDTPTFHGDTSDFEQRAKKSLAISVAFRVGANCVEKGAENLRLLHQ